MPKKCEFDAADMSIINEETDTEFQELAVQSFSEIKFMNISTLIRRQLHQSQLLIQHA